MSPEELVLYKQFRTGLTFKDVRQMLWSYSDDSRDWPNVTRHTVLGKWRQIKLELFYQTYHNNPSINPIDSDIPF